MFVYKRCEADANLPSQQLELSAYRFGLSVAIFDVDYQNQSNKDATDTLKVYGRCAWYDSRVFYDFYSVPVFIKLDVAAIKKALKNYLNNI